MLPPSILVDFGRIVNKVPIEDLKNLYNTLNENPYILSHQFYMHFGKEEKYCLFALLCGLNTSKYMGQSDLAKIRAAHYYALEFRGEDLIAIEEYMRGRYFIMPKSSSKTILSKPEVQEIINVCKEVLQKRSLELTTDSLNTVAQNKACESCH